jgi:steroid delta-isomerase-like uncharacterized protein
MADAHTLILRHHDAVWSRGDLDAVDALYAPDFVGHHPGLPDWVGREGVKLVVRTTRVAFPDFHESVEDVVMEGDRVVTRFTASGTHLGTLAGIPATGRRLTMAEIAVFRIADGRIAEKWGIVDRLSMFQQLGVVPTAWPPLELLYEITMDVTVLDVGPTPGGHRRIVRVDGGAFTGPRLRGEVLPGGGDWVLGRSDGSLRLDVRVALRTEDGELIYASYGGVFCAASAIFERLKAGEPVDPSAYYFRTAPLFETASAKYGWLNGLLAIGYGRRTPGQVSYTVYAIR